MNLFNSAKCIYFKVWCQLLVLLQGGCKLFVVGPWYESSDFTCIIDGRPVPTTCIQPGVLRCYTPGNIIHLLSSLKEGMICSIQKIYVARGRHELSGLNKSSCLPPNLAINCLLGPQKMWVPYSVRPSVRASVQLERNGYVHFTVPRCDTCTKLTPAVNLVRAPPRKMGVPYSDRFVCPTS